MKNISLFVSDQIRMHPNEITVDGLGQAIDPFIILPLDATDQDLDMALKQCFEESKTEVPHRPLQEEEPAEYYKKMGVKSQKELGLGVDVVLEEEMYTITPVNKKGLFGDPVEVNEEEVLVKIRQYLGLSHPIEIVSSNETDL